MGPHSETWTSGGEPVTVHTDCLEGEGEDPCLARHLAAVEFWKGIYPEDT